MTTTTTMGKKKPAGEEITRLDPLLRDLSEKKKSFRNSVISLSSELRDVRNRLAEREDCLRKLTVAKQEAEAKTEMMGQQICLLKTSLEKRDKYLQLEAANNQHLGFNVLHTNEDEEHLKYVDGNGIDQKEIVHVSSNQNVISSGEISDGYYYFPRLRLEIGLLSQELHSHVEKHQTRDEELKMRILELEMCFQDRKRRINTQKLTKIMMRHKRDRALKKIKDEMEVMRRQQQEKNNIANVLESCCLGMIASISMLAILIFTSN